MQVLPGIDLQIGRESLTMLQKNCTQKRRTTISSGNNSIDLRFLKYCHLNCRAGATGTGAPATKSYAKCAVRRLLWLTWVTIHGKQASSGFQFSLPLERPPQSRSDRQALKSITASTFDNAEVISWPCIAAPDSAAKTFGTTFETGEGGAYVSACLPPMS